MATQGRFSVDFEVTNQKDALLAEEGLLGRDEVRRIRIQGVVDTGATRLVLPPSVVRVLGLPVTGKLWCRFADGRREERDVVEYARVQLLGRSDVFSAVVEPGRTDALIGAFVLEGLDIVVDPVAQKLVPRDPRGIFAEIEEASYRPSTSLDLRTSSSVLLRLSGYGRPTVPPALPTHAAQTASSFTLSMGLVV